MHHVNLKTIRLQEMIDWYGTVVGMTPNHQFDGRRVADQRRRQPPPRAAGGPRAEDDPDKIRHTGLHHTAFEYASMDDLLDTYERLKGEGIVPHGCLDHGMTTSFYYADPDGNSVELQSDNFGGDWAQSTEWMRTAPEFAADPIGKPSTPTRSLAARRAGASSDEIHRRAYAGEFTPDTPLDLRLP